jgi:hypothetical protein
MQKKPDDRKPAAPGIKHDGLGDWRLRYVDRLAADVPAPYPSTRQARLPLLLISLSKRARLLKSYAPKLCSQEKVISPWGPGKDIGLEHIGTLYDYFEQCMVCITFSFQALECFVLVYSVEPQ